MKRDIDLERKILLKIEEVYEPGQALIDDLSIDDYELPIIAEHCKLLYQQGLIEEYEEIQFLNGFGGFRIKNMTAQGYDYLAMIRNKKDWELLKKQADEKNIPKTINNLTKLGGTFFGAAMKEILNLS